jgi:hypothetical protein
MKDIARIACSMAALVMVAPTVLAVDTQPNAKFNGPGLPEGRTNACHSVDGSTCYFWCNQGMTVTVKGYSTSPYFDYDGYANCGAAQPRCHGDDGLVGCTASEWASYSDANGRCWAYNDWGPTEHTDCWAS